MSGQVVATLTPANIEWPKKLTVHLGEGAPAMLHTIGRVALLQKRKTAFLCSVRAPGDAILRAHDTAQELRDEGVTVISGFHSPIEKDCLRILLRGEQPIIICLARALENIRLPSDWQRALEAGRLLILSPFKKRPRRPTVESARQRNELVAALSDEVLIIHATPGGNIERIRMLTEKWAIPYK